MLIATVRLSALRRCPTPEEVFLLIEVADSTLNFDRKNKAAIYAKAQIIDYWVIDVRQQQVFVFRDPTPQKYQHEIVWDANTTLVMLKFPDIPILLKNFFP